MPNETCQDCEHFVRHYVKIPNGYAPIIHGHCVMPLIKNRKTMTPACEKFSPRNPSKSAT